MELLIQSPPFIALSLLKNYSHIGHRQPSGNSKLFLTCPCTQNFIGKVLYKTMYDDLDLQPKRTLNGILGLGKPLNARDTV